LENNGSDRGRHLLEIRAFGAREEHVYAVALFGERDGKVEERFADPTAHP
jgi:hypothetical protein